MAKIGGWFRLCVPIYLYHAPLFSLGLAKVLGRGRVSRDGGWGLLRWIRYTGCLYKVPMVARQSLGLVFFFGLIAASYLGMSRPVT